MRKRDAGRRRRGGIRGLGLLLCIAVAWTGLSLSARAADGPSTAEEVLQKAIEAMGGKEAMTKLHSRVTYGRMEIPAMGLKASIMAYAERPGRTRTTMKSEAIGSMEEGGDGENFWEQTAMTGPKVKKGAELARSKREADFDGLMNWKNWYSSAELKGTDSLEGKPAWKVVMTPKDAEAETLWVDQTSGLPVKQAAVVQSDQGAIPVEVFLLDYREVSGVKVPFHLKQSLMKGMQVLDIFTDSLEVNAEIPAGTFDPPAEVKALIEKERAAGATPAEKP